MKRAFEEPSSSGLKRTRPTLSVERVRQMLWDSEDEESEFGDAEYPESELESVSDDDLDLDLEVNLENLDEEEIVDEIPGRDGGGRRPRKGRRPDPDAYLGQGWNKTFTPTDTTFDDSNIGPRNIPENCSEPIDFLNIFLDDEFWGLLCEETNRRADQIRDAFPTYYYAKIWKPVEVKDLKAFMGLRLLMENACVKPRYEEYWNTEDTNFLTHTPGYGAVMSRDRWLSIWTFLHLVNERDENLNKADKIYKVRPLLDLLLPKFRNHYRADQYLSLDEGMIPTKNRLSIKQYLKDKPIKFGIKSFILTEGNTGYIMSAEVYTGREETVDANLGAVGNIVIRLLTSASLEEQNYILTMDRYYNSVKLFHVLHDQYKTLAFGTMQTNRKYFPPVLKQVRFKERGQSDFYCRENLSCVAWQDRRTIFFSSNFHDPRDMDTASRTNKDGTVAEVSSPVLVVDYNTFMGGTDKNDQITRLNKCRRHYRWPRRLLIKFIFWATYNAFVISKHLKEEPGPARKQTFSYFLKSVVFSLVGDTRTKQQRRHTADMPRRLQHVGLHHPIVEENTSNDHVCIVCEKKHNLFKKNHPKTMYKNNPFKRVKTTFSCTECKVYLCIKRKSTCWKDWHQNVEYWH